MFKSNLKIDEVYEKIIQEMIKYFDENNIKSAILGISGGIDSTVVAALVDELRERIGVELYGIMIPSKTTDSTELNVAKKVVNTIVSEPYTPPCYLDNDFESIKNTISESFDGFESYPNLRMGNIKSRLRMIYLYDMAKSKNGIVMGTDNYSEYLLGFSTIGGDGLFDYCPIQFLWKTEVYSLAGYIAKRYALRGENAKSDAVMSSMELSPMDGLGISKSDMDQIGAKDYFEVDTILQHYLNGGEGCPKGVSEESYYNVITRYKSSSYKRNHPVVIKRDAYS